MKKSPLKQLTPTVLDNAGMYHKIKKGIPRVLGAVASMLPMGRGFNFLKTPVTNFWRGGTLNFGNIGSKINQSIKSTTQKRLNLQNKVNNLKYPSSMPKDWNKGGSKKTFENLREFGPSRQTIDYIKNYSKDFGPIIKNMKK